MKGGTVIGPGPVIDIDGVEIFDPDKIKRLKETLKEQEAKITEMMKGGATGGAKMSEESSPKNP